jgi:uncharacterized protein (DUF779 family)
MISRRSLVGRLILGGFAALLAAPSAFAVETPEARIREIYNAYIRTQKSTRKNAPDQLRQSIYSARRRQQIVRLRDACRGSKDMCLPDADFLTDGQDYEITNLSIKHAGGTEARPVIEASFRNFDQEKLIRFELVQEIGRGWVIDQLTYTKGTDPGGTLDDFLKPIPSPRRPLGVRRD